ncbi:MAG: hypothetical protein ICV66_10705 [Chitinophagaceae bacterium]|nr:hypothetical protein [Chitinophagaceae bacterium]
MILGRLSNLRNYTCGLWGHCPRQPVNGENKSVAVSDLVNADGHATGTEVVLKYRLKFELASIKTQQIRITGQNYFFR